MRSYVLRGYFSTALDIAESKGLISHPWRQFIMGHKVDIEARYSTNKRLSPDKIEEIRASYKKCLKYLETRITDPSETDAKIYLQQQLLLAVGYKQDEIDRMTLAEMNKEAFQKLLRDKVAGAMSGNGSKQKLVTVGEIEKFLSLGYEFQAFLPKGKAIMKMLFYIFSQNIIKICIKVISIRTLTLFSRLQKLIETLNLPIILIY
ncbi:hypothetical protein [Caldiplasma sukawensis]